MRDGSLLRSRRDFSVDLHGVIAVCGDQACDSVPVWLRPPPDFLGQGDPFQLSGGGTGVIEFAGIDYLLPYQMARYLGLRDSIVVQSAAAPLAVVPPDLLASIFGANLALTDIDRGVFCPNSTSAPSREHVEIDKPGASVAATRDRMDSQRLNLRRRAA